MFPNACFSGAVYVILHETIEKVAFDMKKPRGDNQAKILAFIKSEIQEKGYPPSVREICDAVGLKSTSTVHGHLQRLQKKGLIHRDAMKPRAMEVLGDPSFSRQEMVQVPVIGRVAAGLPILAQENVEDHLMLSADFLGAGEHFSLRVRGDSMVNAGILEGDYLIVRKQPHANNGDIVVALIDDEATVKRYYKENGHFRLQPENDYMDPIIVEELSILGRVTSLVRRM